MQRTYCWRCRTIVPAFDEEEYAEYRRMMDTVGTQMEAGCFDVEQHRREFVEWYQRTTGALPQEEARDVWNHRLILFGPPCAACGKNLRTHVARKCFECGCPATPKT